MNELIKITESNGKSVVSARELHHFLGVKSKFTDWVMNQAERAMLVANEDYVKVAIFLETSGGRQNAVDYAVSLNSAKEIAMLNGGEKGKQARTYFIECERQLVKQAPRTLKEALLLAVQLEEEKERLQLKNNTLEVRLDILLDWVSIIKVARHNKIKETEFNWRKLKAESEKLGYEIKKAESPRFGFQNLYHVNCFKSCYPKFNYAFKD